MGLNTDIRKGLRDLNRVAGNPTCDISGRTVACVASTLKRGTSIVVGGVEVDVTLTVFVAKPDLASKPNEGNGKVTYQDRTYRIAAVAEVFGGSHYEIDLGDLNK